MDKQFVIAIGFVAVCAFILDYISYEVKDKKRAWLVRGISWIAYAGAVLLAVLWVSLR